MKKNENMGCALVWHSLAMLTAVGALVTVGGMVFLVYLALWPQL